MYPYYFRGNGWEPILGLLQQSLYAEEMLCSISSELYHIPETQDLKGNNEMHNHLVPASYHRVTAVGSARRLVGGEQQNTIIVTMATCIVNAENQDKGVREWLQVKENNAEDQYKPKMRMLIQWQNQAESYLRQAKNALQSMGVSFPSESADQGQNY